MELGHKKERTEVMSIDYRELLKKYIEETRIRNEQIGKLIEEHANQAGEPPMSLNRQFARLFREKEPKS